ncbi:glycoside hydrolase family 30 protein [Phanerochaete sordida]|uniref:Glycoside hydrolase family 30 protein n=1 Tax=Phanerochaete sordida TaxID=48140 RepID=A0A9P3LKE7_9APHY|nr:glycoside hydrolase family 30 protein [Phanerochaete sordida]
MRAFALAASLVSVVLPIAAQQIYDIYATVWDRSQLFTYTNLGSNPINFVTPGAIGDADIVVNDGQVYQTMVGHGASLTDSSAELLNNMKNSNPSTYWSILGYLFDPTDGNGGAGLSYIRVPLGASDFSASVYSYDDVAGDTSLSQFNINKAPSYVFSVLNDIKGINPYLKVHLLPWSPPGWMKDSGTMNGGNFLTQYVSVYAQYLLKSLQGFQSHGITAYAIGVQNEPENSNPSYPTAIVTATQEAQVATALRTLMNNNGFSGTRIVGYDHNWSDAGGYPVQIMQQAPNAFSGVAFHCYSGDVSEQDTFHNAFPSKEIYFTECTGTYGSDWWSDIKWYMDNLYVGSVEHNSMAVLMWNLALDGNGQPETPGSNSCANPPCRPVVTISGSSYTVNQEFYAMAQASKAIVPKDAGGPFAQRIGVSTGGSLGWALRVGAYVTRRVSASDWLRYSLVVLNWDDSASTTWNPQAVRTTIEFRGMQAAYTFPVGVTTLWWYAPATGSAQGTFMNATAKTEPVPVAKNATNATVEEREYKIRGARYW